MINDEEPEYVLKYQKLECPTCGNSLELLCSSYSGNKYLNCPTCDKPCAWTLERLVLTKKEISGT